MGNEGLVKPVSFKDGNSFIVDEVKITPDNVVLIFSNAPSATIPLSALKTEVCQNHPMLVKVRIGHSTPELELLDLSTDPGGAFWFYIKFFNKIFREVFLLIIKLFREVKALPYIKQLESLEQRGQEKDFFSDSLETAEENKTNVGDLLLQLNTMRNVLTRNIKYTKYVIEEKETLFDYTKSLENDLKTTLKDYKELAIRQNLQKEVNIRQIEKVESSIIGIESTKKGDPTFKGDKPPETLLQVRYKNLKEENDNLNKLNKMLLKEVNTMKEKRKEKIKTLN